MKPQIQLAATGGEEQKDNQDSFGCEFETDNGHRITVAKSAIMFVRDIGNGESEVGLRNSRPILVRAAYDRIVGWWRAPAPKYRPQELRAK